MLLLGKVWHRRVRAQKIIEALVLIPKNTLNASPLWTL